MRIEAFPLAAELSMAFGYYNQDLDCSEVKIRIVDCSLRLRDARLFS